MAIEYELIVPEVDPDTGGNGRRGGSNVIPRDGLGIDLNQPI